MGKDNSCQINIKNIKGVFQKTWWSISVLLLLVVCELLVLSKAYNNNILSDTPWLIIWILVGVFLTIVAIGVWGVKVYAFDRLVIKDFLANSLGGGYIAITFLIVFLITCAFVPTLIRDFVAEKQLTWWGLLACIAAIPLEVLLYPTSKGAVSCPLSEREILVSSISASNKDFQINGFYYPFLSCPKLKEVWVIVSKECIEMAKDLYKITDPNQAMLTHIRTILNGKNHPSEDIQIHISKPVDFNDFDNCYKMVKEVFDKIGEEKASRTIVNISPGTVMVGSVLSMFAIQGNRMLGYNRQGLPEGVNAFTESTSNVLSMKELIEEMIIEIQNKRQKN